MNLHSGRQHTAPHRYRRGHRHTSLPKNCSASIKRNLGDRIQATVQKSTAIQHTSHPRLISSNLRFTSFLAARM